MDFCLKLGVTHISCYMLKIEPDTAFGKADISSLNLPDEDTVADMYLFMSNYLQSNGFEHYEISNFCKKGFEFPKTFKKGMDKLFCFKVL